MMNYFDDIKKVQEEAKLRAPIGCTESEVEELENKLKSSLPKAYKEYLTWMGKDFDGVMVGTNCFLTDVINNNEYLPLLLAENNLNFNLPEKYVCFFNHQGYIMAWFELPKESDDPKVYIFSEGTTKEPEEYGLFTEFMSKNILGNTEISIELNQIKNGGNFLK